MPILSSAHAFIHLWSYGHVCAIFCRKGVHVHVLVCARVLVTKHIPSTRGLLSCYMQQPVCNITHTHTLLQASSLPKVVEKVVSEGNQREKAILASLERTSAPSAYVEAVDGYLRELEQCDHAEQANVSWCACVMANVSRCMFVMANVSP